jgi:acetyltransferase
MLAVVQPPNDEHWTTRAGQPVIIRPIHGDDEDRMSAFHRSLSAESVYTRYFNTLKLSARIAHARLQRICHPSPGNETVLVVETAGVEPAPTQIIAVGRLSVTGAEHSGEVAFIVSDAFQRKGIGQELLRRLIADARDRQLRRLCAHILRSNTAMQRLCEQAGMRSCDLLGQEEVTEVLELV